MLRAFLRDARKLNVTTTASIHGENALYRSTRYIAQEPNVSRLGFSRDLPVRTLSMTSEEERAKWMDRSVRKLLLRGHRKQQSQICSAPSFQTNCYHTLVSRAACLNPDLLTIKNLVANEGAALTSNLSSHNPRSRLRSAHDVGPWHRMFTGSMNVTADPSSWAPQVIVEARGNQEEYATLVFLQGLGDATDDWEEILSDTLPEVRICYACVRSVMFMK